MPKSGFLHGKKAVYLHFKGEQTSSDGGLLLIHQLEKKRGPIQPIRPMIQETRLRHWIHHSIPKLFRQRVDQLILGDPGGNDVERLRWDALLKLLLEKLASQPT
ncbi:MAG: transposase [Flavobacteriaceae bacterium]|nr:transposase [Flavobacteriaceae bacterium]